MTVSEVIFKQMEDNILICLWVKEFYVNHHKKGVMPDDDKEECIVGYSMLCVIN